MSRCFYHEPRSTFPCDRDKCWVGHDDTGDAFDHYFVDPEERDCGLDDDDASDPMPTA